VPDVVEQRRVGDQPAVHRIHPVQLAALGEQRERAAGEVVDAERVVEPGVVRAG
jgi:hypothetical protein